MHHRCNVSCTNHHKENNNGLLLCTDCAREALIHSIYKIMSGYKEGRVIYFIGLSKTQNSRTRNKRSGGVESVRFAINASTSIKLEPLKTFRLQRRGRDALV